MGWVDPWVGLGQLADGLGRIGSQKMDLWTTLPQIEWSHSPHGHIAQSDVKNKPIQRNRIPTVTDSANNRQKCHLKKQKVNAYKYAS